jgi:prolyl oligopeptidase
VVLVYGGHGIVSTPHYMPNLGQAWLSLGYSVVLASVRGGGELGISWADQGRGLAFSRASRDLVAVVDDVVARGWADRESTSIVAASYGALVASLAATLRPDVVGKLVLQSGVLDLVRLTSSDAREMRLRVGLGLTDAPDEFLRTSSPRHRVERGGMLPSTLLLVAGDDSTVPSAHSRGFWATCKDVGVDATIVEFDRAGHYFSGLRAQASVNSLIFGFLREL